MEKFKPKGRKSTDIEINRRIYNGHTILLLEDHRSGMIEKDGTSRQYILAVEQISKTGNVKLTQERYITNLMKRKGYASAKEGAMAIFLHPSDFVSIVGENWLPFSEKVEKVKLRV